jgi:hypothetical protein
MTDQEKLKLILLKEEQKEKESRQIRRDRKIEIGFIIFVIIIFSILGCLYEFLHGSGGYTVGGCLLLYYYISYHVIGCSYFDPITKLFVFIIKRFARFIVWLFKILKPLELDSREFLEDID